MHPIATVAAHAGDPVTALQAEAARLAGRPGDIAQRAAILHAIYADSHGNHQFPLIVLHGALWADRYLARLPLLEAALRVYYRLQPERLAHCLGAVRRFVESLMIINRQVFVDTYVNYHLARTSPDSLLAGGMAQELVEAMCAMHRATREGQVLDAAARRCLYLLSLDHEQETMVAPNVERAAAHFDCPRLRRWCLRPAVRFAYFPRHLYFLFGDFSRRAERVRNAVQAYDLAERAGWERVVASMRDYGVLPAAFFRDPARYVATLEARLLAGPHADTPARYVLPVEWALPDEERTVHGRRVA